MLTLYSAPGIYMGIDKNVALERYSKSGGNDLESLKGYCHEEGYKVVRNIATEIDEIQGGIWGTAVGKAEKSTITERSLERLTREYLAAKKLIWVSEQGIAA